jgi:nucleotide-binding universal stress UspA family protein
MFKHILCPIDGSQGSLQALDTAAKLAAEQQAALTICMVVDPSQAAAMAFGDPGMSGACLGALDDEAAQIVHDAAARVAATSAAQTVTLTGQTVTSIVDYAASNACDLVVMGSHGRGGIQRALIGSVAEGVLRHANIPVMVIRWTAGIAKSRPERAAAAAP